MSYEPMLIIEKKGLSKTLPILEEEQYSKNQLKSKVAKYLLSIYKGTVHKFGKLELITCRPELTLFNSQIRQKLNDLNIDFSEE